jgi:hypothetical protein
VGAILEALYQQFFTEIQAVVQYQPGQNVFPEPAHLFAKRGRTDKQPEYSDGASVVRHIAGSKHQTPDTVRLSAGLPDEYRSCILFEAVSNNIGNLRRAAAANPTLDKRIEILRGTVARIQKWLEPSNIRLQYSLRHARACRWSPS